MKRMPPEVPLAQKLNGTVIKVTDFQVLNFFDDNARRVDGMVGVEVVLIYALGEDGVIREFANGKWASFPING